MIKENFKVSYEDLVDQNIKQHILYRYSLESSIRNQLENNKKFTKDTIIRSMEKLNSYGQKHSSSSVILNNEFIYSDISKNLIDEEVEKYYSSKNTSYLIKRIDDSIYMYLNSDIQVSNESVKLLNVYDISSIFLERERQNEYYIKWFIVIVSVYIVSVIIFSKILIAPIKKLNETSKRISNGNYTERTNIQTSDEIGELSKSFDSMTESVESHILKLEKDI
ncbi:MAG: HAMP domain-containing protein, partial [Peptostreptococcaceae bacterium]